MDTLKGLVRTKSFWMFIAVALLGGIEAFSQLPFLGLLIAALTILGVSLQGVETVLAQKELALKHASVLKEIEEAREEAAKKHTEALLEIKQARTETATRHAEALQEIEEARSEAARQYEEATQEIKKAQAERYLLEAEKLATSLMEKDALVNEAVALYPDFRQRELRQLGIEMSAAVIGNVDYLKERSTRPMRHHYDTLLLPMRLEPDERTFFIEHAIKYLTETELQSANADEVGLVYLACVHGYRHQYDDMISVLDRARQIGPIVQVMKGQYSVQPMLEILVAVCGSDSFKVERLRGILALPQPTELYFCTYINQEYLLTPNYKQRGEFSKWLAVRRPDAPEEMEMGSTLIRIAPENPLEVGTGTYAFYSSPHGMAEDIVPPDKKVPVEELYSKISDLFILFCPLD